MFCPYLLKKRENSRVLLVFVGAALNMEILKDVMSSFTFYYKIYNVLVTMFTFLVSYFSFSSMRVWQIIVLSIVCIIQLEAAIIIACIDGRPSSKKRRLWWCALLIVCYSWIWLCIELKIFWGENMSWKSLHLNGLFEVSLKDRFSSSCGTVVLFYGAQFYRIWKSHDLAMVSARKPGVRWTQLDI